MKGTPVFALALAMSASASAQKPENIEHTLRFGVRLADQPDTALELTERMKAYHVPGLSLAIIDNNRVVYAKGFGVTQFGGTKAVDSTTLFLAGSISKPVFVSGFLRLVEDKKISLDADINTLLKSWRLPETRFTAKEKVTPRRLVTHSAGLTVWGFPGYDVDSAVPTVPQLLDGAKPANTPAVRNDTFPGALWRYSGGGITIAQLIATDVTGERLPALMERLVLKPAGMSRSTYENPPPVSRRGEIAWGHEDFDTPVHAGYHVYPEMAAAGLWTTASDLARFAIALTKSYRGERGGILSADMARQMVSKQVHQAPPFGTGWWGLGVAVDGDGDSLTFSHGGRDEGFVATMMMWPNKGRGFVIMASGVTPGLFGEIQRAIAEEYGVGAPPRVERKAATLATETLRDYVGRYAFVNGKDTTRIDISVAPGNKRLSAANSGTRRTLAVVPAGGDNFFGIEGGGVWEFQRDGAGSDAPVKSLKLGQGANARVLLKQ